MKLLSELKSETIQLDHDCSPEEVKHHNKELLQNPARVFVAQCPKSSSVLSIWSFDSSAINNAKSVLAVNIFEVDCGQEEALYLKRYAKISGLPAKIHFQDERVVLKGTKEEVQKSSIFIHEDILQGLYSRKFSFTCKLKIRDYIEQAMLMPHSSEDKSYRHLIEFVGNHRPSNSESEGDYEVYIYSKDPQKFGVISSHLDCIIPTSLDYPISKHGAMRLVMEHKANLENRYQVLLTPSGVSSFVIDGINSLEVQACHDDIKKLVENKLETSEELPISRSHYTLLRLYENEIKEVKGICGIKLKGESKRGDNCTITFTGTIRQVNEAQEKLSDLLNMEIYSEVFTLQCPYSLFRMWKKRWIQIKQQEERNTKTCVNFYPESENRNTLEMPIKFEVIGSDAVCVQEAKEVIKSEGTKMEEREVSLSTKAIESLQKANKEEILKDIIADIKIIEKKSSKVILIAPKELSECLNSAEDLIRKFVGEKANATYFMSGSDPTIDLILSHNLKGKDIAMQATELAQQFKVSVRVQKKPAGLFLIGSESSIEKATPLVKAILESIKSTISTIKVSVEYIYGPYLTSSEFRRFETKLGNEQCTTFSYPKTGLASTSTIVHSMQMDTGLRGLRVTVEIRKGDLVHEQADAIVNAANEDLQHIGGLARAILDAGGQSVQQESDEYIATHKKVATGSAVCLGPGQLPCKKLIHAVGPRWKGGRNSEEQYLYFSVMESLQLAAKENLTSIAFPAIGAGVFGVPAFISAKMSIKAVKDFFQSQPSSLSCVKFILVDSTVSAFLDELKKISIEQDQNLIPLSSKSDYERAHDSTPNYPPRVLPYQNPLTPASPIEDTTYNIGAGYTSPVATYATSIATLGFQPTWEWMNDDGVFTPYSPTQSLELESEYKSNPNVPIHMKIHRKDYTIDFLAMEQVNISTGGTRKIQNRSNSSTSTSKDTLQHVQWEYRERRQYLSYTSQQSAAIEKMFQNGVAGQLTINNAVYDIDFSSMTQTNSLTKYSRKIRRQVSSSPVSSSTIKEAEEARDVDEETAGIAQSDIVITVRGPGKNLETVERMLRNNLKGSLSRYCFEKLPKGDTTKLEKTLSEIARKNILRWSFSNTLSTDGQSQRVMQLNGVSFKCKTAVEAINEEILNFYQSSPGGTTYPSEWEAQTNTTETFSVQRGTVEWNHVHNLFIRTMRGHTVTWIERIQNKWLWEKYDHHKNRLNRKNSGQVNEKELFHGTRDKNPNNIFEGEQGFDTRFSAKGMWGMANYFAADASYSDRYSYQSPNGRQMFLVKVLTGVSFNCPDGDSKLRMPPEKADSFGSIGGGVQFSQMRYDTVTGQTHGTQVFMTYDNDKAYPAYLITYT